MGLLSTEVEVVLHPSNIQYFEDLGYGIPRYYNKKKQQNVVKRGTKIFVKVKDLKPYSNVDVDVQYDCCKKIDTMKYCTYTLSNHDGNLYCGNCVHTMLFSGENNPNWKSSKTQEEREKCRRIDGYDNFVKVVLARDDYSCRCCNQTGGDLIAHHLDGYDWCKEKRVDPSNGVCLCKSCHYNFHVHYGMGNNTKEQFEEWIGKAVESLDLFDGELPSVRQIYCYEDNKVYNGIKEIPFETDTKNKTVIYRVCNRQVAQVGTKIVDGIEQPRLAHNYTYKGKHYFWYNEYISMSQEELEEHLSKGGRPRRVS